MFRQSSNLAILDTEPPSNHFNAPEDWPGPGPIDLEVHDLPHGSSTLEWWYVNTHLQLEGGRQVSIFAAFFRQAASADGRHFTHSIAWGMSFPQEGDYCCRVAVDALAPGVGLANLDAGVKGDDERVERALREVLSRGHVPGPTRMLNETPSVAQDRLALDFSGDCFERLADGSYRLTLRDEDTDTSCQLRLFLEKPPSRYGRDGVVHGVSGERMFYYFVPRARVEGQVTARGERLRVTHGSGWYDHEFGLIPPELPVNDVQPTRRERGETCWRWLSIQLDDGRDLSVFFITRRATGDVLDSWTMLVGPDGDTLAFDDTELETLSTWRSTRTFIEYPTAFRVRVRKARINIVARATFPDQEVISVISDPAFWEGTVAVTGSVGDRHVLGRGWLECKGFGHETLDGFYASVGKEVRSRLADALPEQDLGAARQHLMVRGPKGSPSQFDVAVEDRYLAKSLVSPIREIADRGGKGWRSYAALACIDLVGGDSRKFLHWLVMPEIVHVGSLIVDDVEDESSVRRGGAACHLLHGTAAAINAGTAAYFLAEPPLDQDELPAETKLQIYRLYFDAMRAGHAGQALDLCDISDLVTSAVQSGDTRALEDHVLSVHRLKTAVPAAMFSRVGALLGGGSDEQVAAVGSFFEAIGLAFQIVDDVLNVSGFEHDLKERGEDIRGGKITLPVVKALARLGPEQRQWLHTTLAIKPSDGLVVSRVCDLLSRCGALHDCRELSRQVVERAWADLDRVVEDSQFKLMFRAFSWYVLERHY
jgi:geranylgeranyl pyrophosphate synthase/predicted secreted hydrolase